MMRAASVYLLYIIVQIIMLLFCVVLQVNALSLLSLSFVLARAGSYNFRNAMRSGGSRQVRSY